MFAYIALSRKCGHFNTWQSTYDPISFMSIAPPLMTEEALTPWQTRLSIKMEFWRESIYGLRATQQTGLTAAELPSGTDLAINSSSGIWQVTVFSYEKPALLTEVFVFFSPVISSKFWYTLQTCHIRFILHSFHFIIQITPFSFQYPLQVTCP
jgi:hypothetical protein